MSKKDKTKYVCGKCRGKGKIIPLKKAAEKRNPRVKQAYAVIPCPDCKGSGWVDKQV